MSLRVLAEADLALTLEASSDFGWDIVLTNPAGLASVDLTGQSGDISQVIDPETNQAVMGRMAHVSLRNSTLITQFGVLPEAVQDETKKPWLVTFKDLAAIEYKFKVVEVNPDRTLGSLVLHLVVWKS